MDGQGEIGFQIHALHRSIHRLEDQLISTDERVSGIQGWIIGYLYSNRDKAIYQRDIQNAFSIRRSTVTGILQLMEKNGLITRQSVDFDARLKQLELTPKGMRQHEEVVAGFRRMEEILNHTLSPEEKACFLGLCKKINDGVEAANAEFCGKEGGPK